MRIRGVAVVSLIGDLTAAERVRALDYENMSPKEMAAIIGGLPSTIKRVRSRDGVRLRERGTSVRGLYFERWAARKARMAREREGQT